MEKIYRYSAVLVCLLIAKLGVSQNTNYYFVEDIYQRSYINPALNNEGTFMLASGLGVDVSTNGPGLGDLLIDSPTGNPTLSAATAIENMDLTNDLYGYTSVNTFDASIKILPGTRLSIGHAWKANGWLEYNRDLISFATFGNGPSVGETLSLGPQIEFMNYNELYLGLQKSFGILSIGARVKRLNGVETIVTERSKADLTTSDDIYQLTLDSDYMLRSSRAFTYQDINDFDLDVENFSFDNFLSKNGGWAFDLGISAQVSDRIELSAAILDMGSITWDVDPVTYTSQKVQTFEGVDIAEYISTEDELVLTDSLEALLDFDESNEEFSTSLPTQVYLGGRFKISDLWTIGAIIKSVGSGDRATGSLGLNVTANVYKWLSIGSMYSYRDGNPANIGLNLALRLGPVAGFLSTDNVITIGSYKSKAGNIRAGLSIRI